MARWETYFIRAGHHSCGPMCRCGATSLILPAQRVSKNEQKRPRQEQHVRPAEAALPGRTHAGPEITVQVVPHDRQYPRSGSAALLRPAWMPPAVMTSMHDVASSIHVFGFPLDMHAKCA
jgi:hypothetical protein